MIELNINADDLRQVPHFWGLQKRDIERAMLRAINKTARWLRTRIAREVATELNVKVGLARNSLQRAPVLQCQGPCLALTRQARLAPQAP